MDRIEQLKDFLKSSPDDSFLQHALALEYIKRGDDEKAKIQFQQLLNQNENYVGSYYHLAKLLERNNDKEAAIAIYQKGMKKAKEAGDNHAYNELQSACEDLMDF
jgi:Tfp pilus assembly protein PilF